MEDMKRQYDERSERGGPARVRQCSSFTLLSHIFLLFSSFLSLSHLLYLLVLNHPIAHIPRGCDHRKGTQFFSSKTMAIVTPFM